MALAEFAAGPCHKSHLEACCCIAAAIDASHGRRSSSVSGCPDRIFAADVGAPLSSPAQCDITLRTLCSAKPVAAVNSNGLFTVFVELGNLCCCRCGSRRHQRKRCPIGQQAPGLQCCTETEATMTPDACFVAVKIMGFCIRFWLAKDRAPDKHRKSAAAGKHVRAQGACTPTSCRCPKRPQ